QLLDAAQDRLALPRVELAGLLAVETVDVGIAAVGVDAAAGHESLDAGGRVAGGAAQPVDDVPELLLLVRLQEARPLERPQPRADPHRLQVVEQRLAGGGGPCITPEVAGV